MLLLYMSLILSSCKILLRQQSSCSETLCASGHITNVMGLKWDYTDTWFTHLSLINSSIAFVVGITTENTFIKEFANHVNN